MKSSASLCGARDSIQRPTYVELLDYEIELGLVIGKPIVRQLELESNWRSYIAGLVIANDVSARDVQLREGQWVKAKSYRTFCPAGPYFLWLEPSDCEHIYNLEMELKVNGEVRQRSNTVHQIYRASETLRELSQIADLHPGDLVLTGTPGGVALQAPRPLVQRLARMFLPEALALELFLREQKRRARFLQEGDVMEARIWNEHLDLGVQRTRVGSVVPLR